MPKDTMPAAPSAPTNGAAQLPVSQPAASNGAKASGALSGGEAGGAPAVFNPPTVQEGGKKGACAKRICHPHPNAYAIRTQTHMPSAPKRICHPHPNAFAIRTRAPR